ncbi:MAG: hypothetical protein K0R76_119 [Alphaproteobacteria bacterium]|jgi:uncharacterized protein YdbL (DUF1318 family)|nr:hypothetical protein [Alphaproteobacteria bacterium]MDF3033165.1 hypothetical protein [Alphaproteobacteria bacterium]
MMKKFALLLGLAIIAISPANATDLASALSTGKVCEMPNGYIQATPGNEAEMAGLVAEVNNKRASVYAEIAAKEGLNPAAVGVESARQERAANPGKFCR